MQLLVKRCEERYRLMQQKKYGASSEKTSPEQGALGLLDEAENEANARVLEPALEIITYKRRKREGKREEDLSDLPVERIGHTLPGEERVCPACNGPMRAMGRDARRELKIVPVTKAPMPEPVIKGSEASPSSGGGNPSRR